MKSATITAGSYVTYEDRIALVLSAKSGWLELGFTEDMGPDNDLPAKGKKVRSGKCTLLPMHEAIAKTLEAEAQFTEAEHRAMDAMDKAGEAVHEAMEQGDAEIQAESEAPATIERSWLNDDQIEVF
ncbi:hypothetical protein JT06_18565, partial [Desulfobulbus sp. Tol-SR]